jgi:hypothetical protein
MGMDLGLKAKEVIEILLKTVSIEQLVKIAVEDQFYSDLIEQTIKA